MRRPYYSTALLAPAVVARLLGGACSFPTIAPLIAPHSPILALPHKSVHFAVAKLLNRHVIVKQASGAGSLGARAKTQRISAAAAAAITGAAIQLPKAEPLPPLADQHLGCRTPAGCPPITASICCIQSCLQSRHLTCRNRRTAASLGCAPCPGRPPTLWSGPAGLQAARSAAGGAEGAQQVYTC